MKQTKLIMGMPITIEIVDKRVDKKIFISAFTLFRQIDKRFSTFKKNSEISKLNRGEIPLSDISPEMKEIFSLAAKTKAKTKGFFDINHEGIIDPSGLVKGWAIAKVAKLIEKSGYKNFFVDAGGDIYTSGVNRKGLLWRVGVKNPFSQEKIVKVVALSNGAIATSGNYIRGNHIYIPTVKVTSDRNDRKKEVVSLSVIGKDICMADCFATAAFAMGEEGITFIEAVPGYEGYQINREGIATMTSGFSRYAKTY